MTGNVWEWCNDQYSDQVSAVAVVDPSGPQATNGQRVFRHGSWGQFPPKTYRGGYGLLHGSNFRGFRVVARSPKVVEDNFYGTWGLGTWETSAEFQDVSVSVWRKPAWNAKSGHFPLKAIRGNWSFRDGVSVQAGLAPNCMAVGGPGNLREYELSFNAKKIRGKEGFLIPFRMKDGQNFYRINLGGHGNTQHVVEKFVAGKKTICGKPIGGRIAPDHWYSIRVQVNGYRVRCFIDGNLVLSTTI